MESMQSYQAGMNWEKGRAQQHCSRQCEKGPQVSNISHGPDDGGHMVVRMCDDCGKRAKKAIPSMNVVTDEGGYLQNT